MIDVLTRNVENEEHMRILHIHNINRVAEAFNKELIQRGHCSSLYQPNLEGSGAALPMKIAKMPQRLFSLRDVVKELCSNKFDIVHIHWASYGLLGLVSNTPFIIECHGDDVRSRLRHPLFRVPLRAFLRKASAVLCITPDLLPVVQEVIPRALFFPGPIDTDVFAPELNEPLNDTRPCTILLFTRLDPVKGCDIAIQGIVQFAKRHPDVRVKLLEWGPLSTVYKQRYQELFEFIPFVASDQVHQLIQSADIVVGQVVSGVLGLSELQAMSCAKPVITSFLYKDAYPTPPPCCQATNALAVEQQLENLYLHPERGAELGQRARAWVIQNHRTQVLTDQLEKLYSVVVGQKCSKGRLCE